VSVLKGPIHFGLMSLVLIGLAGCDHGTPAYRHIKDLPYSEWDRYAASLPIEQALDLQKELREKSGHNPQMTIEGAFANRPVETYNAIVRRIRDGDTSRYYLGVIYEINRSPRFKICSQSDRAVVQTYLSNMNGYPGQKRDQPSFYTC
jgi:hypothetical protein